MAKAQRKKHKCINNSHDQIKSKTNTINNNPINSLVKCKRKIFPRDSPLQRSSKFRGVTRHRWTGRYEAHLWDKDCWIDSQKKKGKQVYLGAYDDEVTAARAYDLAALKYWGKDTILNFSLSNYENEMKVMDELTKEEYLGSLRRKSNGFSRGVSKYRGVARHHHNGRWEARIGRVLGNKYLYLGTFATQEEAATAYDMAAIQYRGLNAVTNFDLSRYPDLLKPNISCDDDQPSPNNVDPINNLIIEDNNSASTCSSDNHQTSLKFDHHHHHHHHHHPHHHPHHHQLIDDAISIDELLWDPPPMPDCSSTLLLDHFNNEYDLLRCDQAHDNIMYSSMDGQCSSMDDVGNNKDQDFFSDLDSLLCDFDVMEAKTVEKFIN